MYKTQIAPGIGGYTRAIIMFRYNGKYIALDWMAMDIGGEYCRT